MNEEIEKLRTEAAEKRRYKAVSNKEYHRLQNLLGLVANVLPSFALLKEAGVGHQLADRRLWGFG